MYRIPIQRTLLVRSCLKPPPSPTLIFRTLRRSSKPSFVIGSTQLATFPLHFKSNDKAFRIGSLESPATPSEIEQVQLHYESKYSLVRLCKRIAQFLDVWVLEPILTLRRLTHILILFIPVVVTVPVVFFGERNHKEAQTYGTLWWFDFIAKQMERAGPTFIKVRKTMTLYTTVLTKFS